MRGSERLAAVAALAAALAIAVLAALLVVWTRRRADLAPAAAGASVSIPDGAAPPAAESESVPTIEARAAVEHDGEAPRGRGAVPAVRETAIAPNRPDTSVALRMRLNLGPIPMREILVRVSTYAANGESSLTRSGGGGGTSSDRAELVWDITDHFREPQSWPQRVVVELHHDAFGVVSREVPMSVDGEPLNPDRLRERKHVELIVDLAVPDVATATGEIAADYQPGDTGHVAIFYADDRRQPTQPGPIKGLIPGSRSFEIVFSPTSHAWLVVYARGLQPATIELGAVGLRTVDVGTIALARGASIRGRVDLEGKVAGVIARRAPTTRRERRFGQAPLAWIDGRFEWDGTFGRLGPEREFEVSGLWPGLYDVEIVVNPPTEAARESRVRVEAPATDVVIIADVVALLLELRRGGERLPRTGFEWTYVDVGGRVRAGSGFTDDDGRIAIWLRPRTAIELTDGDRKVAISAGAASDADWRVIEL